MHRLCFVESVSLLLANSCLVAGIQLLTLQSIPANLSTGCQAALLADVDCSLMVSKLRHGYFYPTSILEKTCTEQCASGLVTFEQSILAACVEEIWEGYDEDGEMPVSIIPNLMRYQYDLTCLQDSGRFCNVIAGQAAAISDPGDSTFGYLGTVDNSTIAPNPCDLCFVKSLNLQAGSPYYNGPNLASQSVYESKTSICGITNMPLITSSLPATIPPMPTSPPVGCAGITYQIKAGDDCHRISISEGISTAWLLTDNDLATSCADFPTSGELCIVNSCAVYTVQTNDTCKSIAKLHNATEPQLLSWNPVIKNGCTNIARLVGDELCVDQPGTKYIDPSSTVLAPTTASTAAPIPTDVSAGVNTYCGKYYQVQPDEYCNILVLRFGISLKDFVFLNPALNENCTNLFAYESYCIQAVGDINTYSGRPGASTATPVTTLPFTAVLSMDPTTDGTPIVTSTALPLAEDTRDDCSRYFAGSELLDEDITGTSFVNVCQFAATMWAVTLDEFQLWNPSLGNLTASVPECEMMADVRYCAKLKFADAPPEAAVPSYRLEIREGAIETCTEYADVYEDWSCTDVLNEYDLTIAQFYEYNPVIGADCTGLWPGYAYCIRTPDYIHPDASSTTTMPPSTTTTSVEAPTATHPGQPANCNKWHIVVEGDTCSTIPSQEGITSAQFFAWNPAVSSDCLTNFWQGYAYCVGVSSSATATATTAPPATTNTSVPAVPSPTQDGNAVSNCNAYAEAQEGDWCAAFAERNGISLVNFYAWNSVLGANGENCGGSFWATYWYCIGVA